jgi:hypothetical protein
MLKKMQTDEQFGVISRKYVYKKPIPIDTINKFCCFYHNKKNNEIIRNQACDL